MLRRAFSSRSSGQDERFYSDHQVGCCGGRGCSPQPAWPVGHRQGAAPMRPGWRNVPAGTQGAPVFRTTPPPSTHHPPTATRRRRRRCTAAASLKRRRSAWWSRCPRTCWQRSSGPGAWSRCGLCREPAQRRRHELGGGKSRGAARTGAWACWSEAWPAAGGSAQQHRCSSAPETVAPVLK